MWPAEGSWIQVSIKDGQVLQGRLFHLDSALQLVTIVAPVVPDDYESLPAPLRPSLKHTVQLVSTASVLDVQAISVAGGAASLDMPAVRPLKVERIMRREQKALQKRHAQFGSRAPSGTSEMAMQVFAALAKTYWPISITISSHPCNVPRRLPCYWHRPDDGGVPTIVVLGEVHVCAPYTAGNCRGTIKSNPALVERVRKVLDCERRRLGLDKPAN